MAYYAMMTRYGFERQCPQRASSESCGHHATLAGCRFCRRAVCLADPHVDGSDYQECHLASLFDGWAHEIETSGIPWSADMGHGGRLGAGDDPDGCSGDANIHEAPAHSSTPAVPVPPH